MSLSDDERDRLLEIETLTAVADPQFARRLDLAAAVRHRRQARRACWTLLVVGAWMMLTGAGAARGWISLGTVLAVTGGALVVWSAVTAYSLRSRRA